MAALFGYRDVVLVFLAFASAAPVVYAQSVSLPVNNAPLSGDDSTITVEGSAAKRTFTARAGDRVSFDWNFLTNAHTHLDAPETLPDLDRNDFAFVSIMVDADPAENLLLADSTWTFSLSATSFTAETGFDTFSFTLPVTGVYILGIGVVDVGDAQLPSGLLLDNVILTPADL